MEEIWKDVVGSNGLYMVSNYGNVKSLHYRGGNYEKILIPKKNNSGRLWVEITINGRRKAMLIHRLVAYVFLDNPNGYNEINHIDENPLNNYVDNLEWCDRKYNVQCFCNNHPDHFRNKKQTEKYGKRLSLPVMQVSKNGEVIRVWNNSREVMLETGMSDWSISECCRGNRKTAYGYNWRYVNDDISGKEIAL